MARSLAALFTFSLFVLPSVLAYGQALHIQHSLALSALVVLPNYFAPAVSAYVVTVPTGFKRNTLQSRKHHKNKDTAVAPAAANTTAAAANTTDVSAAANIAFVAAVANATAADANVTASIDANATADANATISADANSTSTSTSSVSNNEGDGNRNGTGRNSGNDDNSVDSLIDDALALLGGIFTRRNANANPGPVALPVAVPRPQPHPEPRFRRDSVVRRRHAAAYHERAF
ncbi:hypothetical protein A1O1_07381 [Capronia coronata CBS 617.96]|uniref:Uncharacterized protein n=1 Tax=Capronia coronata CBS 617.96 TaxID=1182541 RepID=W9Y275_9EURO|nr:uncharacterized protein A1O1_07381 [Capronia coronata CBS 617.96]EXJ83755.1 hypothetical protein A1O1_07381 [Capronia coronata CBS 617.96]